MKSVGIELPDCLHSLLFELAEMEGRTIQDLIIEAVRQYASATLDNPEDHLGRAYADSLDRKFHWKQLLC